MKNQTENSSYAKVNGISISYIDEGPREGLVIIFIHGFPLNKSMWREQIDSLKGHFRAVAYDIRGHGESNAEATDFSIDQFADDLMGLMDYLKLKRAIFCGLSMGGYIALTAMEKHPNRCEGLVLCNTQCTADTEEAKEKRKKAALSIQQNGVDKYAEVNLKNLFTKESFSKRKNVVKRVREMMTSTSKSSLLRSLQALAGRRETCGKLSEIDVPVLITTGRKDPITPPPKAELMHRKIKNSALYIFENSGHLSNLEYPYKFNDQLIRFLNTIKKKTGIPKVNVSL
nr:alpha/beta fold hydrolase [Saprospiraceae bacterium]